MNVRREELRKDSPDMHHMEVTKKIGEEWMTLSDEKKQPYLDAAKQDKIRYDAHSQKTHPFVHHFNRSFCIFFVFSKTVTYRAEILRLDSPRSLVLAEYFFT